MHGILSEPNAVLWQATAKDLALDARETELFATLLNEWQSHVASNMRNESYYRGKVGPVTNDADMPADLRRLNVAMGWGGKAVDVLASRSVFQGWGGSRADELADALGGIDFGEVYEQAVVSELTDSCAFVTVSRGAAGEPAVVVNAYSALDATAIWDERRKRVRAGLVVRDVAQDQTGQRVPTLVTMYTDGWVYECARQDASKPWRATKKANPLGRPAIEPLRYRPSLTRPFGKSRITPTMRSLIDRAIAVGSRTEVTAMFYTWPQRYLLGVDRSTAEAMSKRKIEAYADSMILVTPNKNGDTPQYGQLSQATMQPHIDHLEMLGKQFASEACLPLDEVGIVFDNPSSAEAMDAAQKRLTVEAEHVNRMNGHALGNVAKMALAVASDGEFDPAADVRAVFAPVLKASSAAAADFAVKVASMNDGYAETAECWQDLGYDPAAAREMAEKTNAAKTRLIATSAAANAAAKLSAGTA